MQTNIWKKGLVLGIFIMFIVISFIPGIGANFGKPINRLNLDIFENTWKLEKFLIDPPGEEWNNTFGGTDMDIGVSVQQTTDGGYVVVGWTDSYGAGGSDVWIIKTDSNGNEDWSQTLGGPSDDYGYSVQQTSDDGYIIAGFTESFGAGNGDIWLIKTDSTGSEVWNMTYGGPEGEFSYCVQQTTDGGYIITGYTGSYGAGNLDAWLIKTDSNGNEEWNQTYGGIKWDYGQSVKQTYEGGFIIAGYTDSYGAGHNDVWLIKTDSNGDEEWNQTFGDSMWDFGRSVLQTADGGYIITGWTWTFDEGIYDVWLIRTDPGGNMLWDKKFGGNSADDGYFVQHTADGGFIISGDTSSYGAGSNDAWLIKTDSNGNEEWNQTYGGANSEWGYSVQQTSDGGYILAGITSSYGSGSYDSWLIRIETDNNPPYEPTNPYPEHDSIDVDVKTNLSWIGGDPDGDEVTYDVYFGTTNPPPKVVSNQTETTFKPGTMDFNTTYYWRIVAWDYYSPCTEGQIWKFVTHVNYPPEPPNINGPNSGKPGQQLTYVFNATDPEGEDVRFIIDWGDSNNYTTYFVPSGTDKSLSYKWDKEDTYTITVKAEDTSGNIGAEATLTVTIPRNKLINNPFLNWLQNHPKMFLLIQKLIQKQWFGI